MKKLLAAIALAAVVLGLAQSFDTVSTRVTRIETRRAVKSIEINFTPDGKFQDAMVYIVDRVVDTNGAVVYAETPGVSKQLDRQWIDATKERQDAAKAIESFAALAYQATKNPK